MPRVPDLPCAGCGSLLWRGSTSLPAGQAKCRPCRAALPTSRVNQRKPLEPKPCPECGAEFIGRRGQQTCSRKCSQLALERARKAPCADCGSPCDPKSSRCHRCHVTVKYAHLRAVVVQPRAVRMAIALQQRTAARPASRRIFRAGTCRVCSSGFITLGRVTATCGPACAAEHTSATRRDHDHRRRARMRGAFVAPVYRRRIFERDNWTCQICLVSVDRDSVVPHPRAPTLDHVIPLARGGTHEPSNTQLACFRCNCAKGDKVAA